VDSTEEPIHRLHCGRRPFPFQQRPVAGVEMLAAFG
jgi:hypothetical protein